MRVIIFQTAVSVIVSTVAFVVSPMFFPFVLIGAFCAIYGPVAVIASFQRPPASRSRSEAAREDGVVAGGEASSAPRAAPPLPARA